VPLFDHAADTSFPSEHTLVGVALALALGRVLGRWGVLPVLWALLIGVARIAAAVHYPSDVLGSALLAVPLAALSWWIVNQLTQWRGLLPRASVP
jgi:undecaprenyl-diphosphatase